MRSLIVALAASLLLAPWPSSSSLHAAGDRLPGFVPGDALFVLHFSDLARSRQRWERTPFARTWAEPQVERFLAPLRAKMDLEKLSARFSADAGFELEEFVAMFTGEAAMVISGIDFSADEPAPSLTIMAEIGNNRARLEKLFRERPDSLDLEEEEFQGELLLTSVQRDADSGERTEDVTLAFVDDLLLFGQPKAAVQQAIVAIKRSPSTTIADQAGFGALRHRQPEGDFIWFLNLEALVPVALDFLRAQASPNPLGVTPDSVARALGLDNLTGLGAIATMGEDATVLDLSLHFRSDRGLVRLAAYTDGAVPQPAFVSPDWNNVSVERFSFPLMFGALLEMVGAVSPAIDGLVKVQLSQFTENFGFDLQRDLVGSFGDEVVTASKADVDADDLREEQLMAFSLRNPDALQRSLATLTAQFPPIAAMISEREYLGEIIRTFSPPAVEGVPPPNTISYAVTRNHFFLSIGGAGMVETAIQGLQGGRPSLWDNPTVRRALAELPPGAVGIGYVDLRQLVGIGLKALLMIAEQVGGDDEGERWFDPSAKPSEEAIARHWGTAAGATYRERNALIRHMRIAHPQ
jgi:hypothetical protein